MAFLDIPGAVDVLDARGRVRGTTGNLLALRARREGARAVTHVAMDSTGVVCKLALRAGRGRARTCQPAPPTSDTGQDGSCDGMQKWELLPLPALRDSTDSLPITEHAKDARSTGLSRIPPLQGAGRGTRPRAAESRERSASNAAPPTRSISSIGALPQALNRLRDLRFAFPNAPLLGAFLQSEIGEGRIQEK